MCPQKEEKFDNFKISWGVFRHSFLKVCQNTPMKNGKAYSYIRFSTAEQAAGHSYHRQRAACEQWCAENGLTLATNDEHIFFDKGVSAFTGGNRGPNGQLARFLQLVHDGHIEAGSTLIVENLDRLSRDHVQVALGTFLGILEAGITIVTLQDGKSFEPKSTEPTDLIISIFVMSRAHEESLTKSKRVSAAWTGPNGKHELARKENKPKGKSVPTWIKLQNDRYVLDEEKAEIVRKIFELTIAGYGKGVVAKQLNLLEIPSFRGKSWGSSSVAKVLGNRATIGEYQPMHRREPSGEPVPGYFPKVIDEHTFYAAKASIDGRRVAKATKQSANFQVWQGVGLCSTCYSAMHIVNKGTPPKGNRYLICSKGRKGLCRGKSVRADFAEAILGELLAKLDARSLTDEDAVTLRRRETELNGRIVETRQKLSAHVEAAEKFNSSRTIYDLIVNTENQLAVLEREKQSIAAQLEINYVEDREEFLKKLDLVSYEGRYKANNLLKRLGVKVSMKGGEEPCFVAFRKRMEFNPLQHVENIIQLIRRKNGAIVIIPMNDEQRALYKLHDAHGADAQNAHSYVREILLKKSKPRL